MAKNNDTHQFILYKEQLIDTLGTLQDLIVSCEDQGMLDPNSTQYNELLVILEEANYASTLEELDEVITKGKELEYNMESWLSRHGGSTFELDWPNIKKP